MNDEGVLLTADDGAHWRTVTPPSMRAQPVLLDHVDGIAAFGVDRVWLLVSANAGYGTRLVYTRDAGKSWRTTPLVPGPSGEPSSFLSADSRPTTPAFLNANDGWILATVGRRGRGAIFRTRDGGAHWSFLAMTPFRGGSLVFSSHTSGWAITAPTWTYAGTIKKAGGTLYHSTDGGAIWRRVDLPAIFPTAGGHRRPTVTFGLPAFFGQHEGVLAGRSYDTGSGAERVIVFTTSDGGRTWQGRLAPQNPATRRYQQGFFTVPFAAASPSHWATYAGSTLYTTTDAGVNWTTVHPKLPKIIAAVDQLYSADPTAMWAQGNGHVGVSYPPYLLRSTDSGRTFTTLSP